MKNITIKTSDYKSKTTAILKIIFEVKLLLSLGSSISKEEKSLLIEEIYKLKQLFEAHNPQS
jgi:hypothetical protein